MIGCIIQARMNSYRLIGKVMMKVDKKHTMIEHVIKQLEHSNLLDKIVVATTDLDDDNVLVEHLQSLGINYYRGSENDVLDRYYQCAKKFSFSTVVRVTSDCPLIDPEIVDAVISKFKVKAFDYVSNTIIRTFPYGTEVEVFPFSTLKNVWKEAEKPSEREHVTLYLHNNKEKFSMFNLQNDENISSLRWTVDTEKDLELVRLIIAKIQKRPILTKDIVMLIKNEPSLLEINKNYDHNEGMKKTFERDQLFFKKKFKNK